MDSKRLETRRSLRIFIESKVVRVQDQAATQIWSDRMKFGIREIFRARVFEVQNLEKFPKKIGNLIVLLILQHQQPELKQKQEEYFHFIKQSQLFLIESQK